MYVTALYNLVRCCLPYSLKVHEEKLKANSLTQMQLPDYVRDVRKNIYAYHKRLEQVEQFKVGFLSSPTFVRDICYHISFVLCYRC